MSRTIFIDGGGNSFESFSKYRHLFPADHTYVFEPNPKFWSSYAVAAEDVTLIKQAIWHRDGPLEFWRSRDPREVASSLLEYKLCKVNGDIQPYWQPEPIIVECVDFPAWLCRHYQHGNRVILKLDIEGAEIPVLWQMLHTGTIKMITELHVEFHLETIEHHREHYGPLFQALAAVGIPPKPWD